MAQLLKFPLHSSASGKLTQALLCLTQQYQCSCVAVGATCCSAVPNPDIGQNGQLRTTPTTPRPGLLRRPANSSSRQSPKLLRRPTEPGEGWVGGWVGGRGLTAIRAIAASRQSEAIHVVTGRARLERFPVITQPTRAPVRFAIRARSGPRSDPP